LKILLTGAAGFIGFHATTRFLVEGHQVIGLDCINDYYDVNLKYARLKELGIMESEEGVFIQSTKYPGFSFVKGDITDKILLEGIFEKEKFNIIVHFAAQAGVRYSLVNPDAYIQSNIIGFYNILEACRKFPVKHLLYASSSSVYGNSIKVPFKETDMTDDTVSLYAATKKSNELLAYNYSHLFKIPTTGLRFFTVYGPWGRPDMAYYGFAEKIVKGEEISLFNGGDMYRDFTYIEDIVEGIYRLLDLPPTISDYAVPKRILNIGHSSPVYMKEFISLMEDKLAKKAVVKSLPMQNTDVYKTYADITELEKLTGYCPVTHISVGMDNFISWFSSFKVNEEN
jgi:UDP-glucuronate 4-epimerase